MPSHLSRARVIRAFVALAALVHALPAQRAWRLPPGGAAVFEEHEELRWFPVAEPRRRPARPFRRAPHAPILFASELDDDGHALRLPPADVRWLGAAIAFDWGHARRLSVDERVEWMEPFGHLRLKGRAKPVSPEGEQLIELDVGTFAPRQGDVPDRAFAHWLEVNRKFDAKGRLVVRRTLDDERGVVAAFSARLELDCVRREDRAGFRLELAQEWRLQELRENRGAGFEGRVAESVARAAKHLHGLLAERTDWDRVRETSQSEGPGAWALMLLALLHAEYDPEDTVVRARLQRVRRAELTETYTLSLAILLIEKLYAPRGERDALISGALERSVAREPSRADRLLLEKWTARLLANRDKHADRGYVSRWAYTGNGYDNSNTQFALLALHAAALCGVDVSRGVWHSAARHLLDEQVEAEAKAARLQLIPHRDARGAGAPHLLDRSAIAAAPRGFTYRGADGIPYGAMTAAGISGMTLCLANLVEPRGRRAGESDALEQAVRDSFAWLSRHRTLRRVAGDDVGHHDYWYYYWLYSLERACELSQTAWIGEWDWYYEGAELLLAGQRDDGSWGSPVDTCFALLFLKQAQLPVITGLREKRR